MYNYGEKSKVPPPKLDFYCTVTITGKNKTIMDNTVGNTVDNTVGNTVDNTVDNTVGNMFPLICFMQPRSQSNQRGFKNSEWVLCGKENTFSSKI